MQCPSCSKKIPEESVVCPFYATPQDDAPTSASTSAEDAEPVGPAPSIIGGLMLFYAVVAYAF